MRRTKGSLLPTALGALTLALASSAALAACSATGTVTDNPTGGPPALAVVASFYPLEYALQQVGGPHVRVTNLTKPGAEPHDLELSPKNVGAVEKAALVVYEKGFQPAVDTAVEQEAADHAFDVAPAARLDRAAPTEDDHDHAAADPHFWLDPVRYAAVATALGQRLAAVDPANAAAYASGAETFADRLADLDADLSAALSTCANRELVTSHSAFGYLSERYGFTQVSIAGLSPEAEPSAAKLAEVANVVREHRVTTIYAETLVEPAFADTVSRSTGARLATLDPVEGLTSESAGSDYLEVMRANLATLREGQDCR